MPTKRRRQREQEQRALRQEMDKALPLPLPDHLIPFASEGNNEFRTGLPGGGLVQIVEDDFFLHENIGKGGNDCRQANRFDKAVDLKRNYPHLWGKRGKAKVIAMEEKCSERTVQKYFKDFP